MSPSDAVGLTLRCRYNNLGNALKELGELDEAIESYRTVRHPPRRPPRHPPRRPTRRAPAPPSRAIRGIVASWHRDKGSFQEAS